MKVVLPGHGRQELSHKVAGNVMRQLIGAGYDKELLRKELRGAA